MGSVKYCILMILYWTFSTINVIKLKFESEIYCQMIRYCRLCAVRYL